MAYRFSHKDGSVQDAQSLPLPCERCGKVPEKVITVVKTMVQAKPPAEWFCGLEKLITII